MNHKLSIARFCLLAPVVVCAYVIRIDNARLLDLEPEWNRFEVSALNVDGIGENCVWNFSDDEVLRLQQCLVAIEDSVILFKADRSVRRYVLNDDTLRFVELENRLLKTTDSTGVDMLAFSAALGDSLSGNVLMSGNYSMATKCLA